MNLCVFYSLILFIFSLMMFFFSLYFLIFDWSLMLEFLVFSFNSSSVYVSFLFDWMSLLFMSFVMFISSMVIFYSLEYMEGDLNINRFIVLVFMFVVFMLFLIISPNLISILLGWDGLGLVSYCLVIYFQSMKSYNAGMLTVLSNRLGDVALLISIAWMFNYGSWNFIYYLNFYYNDKIMEIICFLVFFSAFTKSAQIPFSSWLPAAMEAPTPVSSLVHSSTLVTAGVYLLIRFSSGFSEYLLVLMLYLSCVTMLMSGIAANYEYDLKKIIALSTLSQLGFMIMILSLGDSSLAFFHLLTHALFKALLFLCAGCMIHNMMNCQDIRWMGCLINQIPLIICFFNISNLSLCGIPFLIGFYSKDLILDFMSMNYMSLFIYLMVYFSMGLTVSYSVRLSYYLLWGWFNFKTFFFLNNLNLKMLYGMGGLMLMVIFGGGLMNWLIFPLPYFICLPLMMKIMILFFILLGLLFGLELSFLNLSINLISMNMLTSSLFFSSMFNLSLISIYGLNNYFLGLGNFFYKFFDLGWFEYYGSQNIYFMLKNNSSFYQFMSKNSLKIYLLLFIFWIIFLFFF